MNKALHRGPMHYLSRNSIAAYICAHHDKRHVGLRPMAKGCGYASIIAVVTSISGSNMGFMLAHAAPKVHDVRLAVHQRASANINAKSVSIVGVQEEQTLVLV